ncbi:MAG: hypothetical protein HY549_11615 [Elusimicrobia bacterium]|nr:hypothetical protein [Elusimicrobiota bacterium]
MRGPRRQSLLIVFLLACIVATAILYLWIASSFFDRPSSRLASRSRESIGLKRARLAFRDQFLDPEAHLLLAEALFSDDRLIDSFYILAEARRFFRPEAFSKAHEKIILKKGLLAQVAAQLQAEALAESNAVKKVGLYTRFIHASPDSYEGRMALRELGQWATPLKPGAETELSIVSREALIELNKARPDHARIFFTLALSYWEGGDRAAARAIVAEALRGRSPGAGAAAMDGVLALAEKNMDRALKRFTRAWNKDKEDGVSASHLFRIHFKQRNDEESALPYLIALYRLNPDHREIEPSETLIRRILDFRRARLLKDARVEELGRHLDGEDASLRAEASLRAAELGAARWIGRLGQLLDDDTEIVRHNADYALYQLAKKDPGPVLAKRQEWLSSTSPLGRCRALGLFADLSPEETLPQAERALKDPSPVVRSLTKAWVMDRYYAREPKGT